ncbi:MAG: hypothetical protein QGF18_00380 [Alphaproteobacteria bacterium]|jgi:hypothetical protein|nr:hypothetical protein [Rhodospirillaceae bacterium]MDP6031590.1 hypothetical protein [Alphaproteobacteria bacterium]MDP7182309.1 hypothetical protein [Alphaproteobacteria bacterium]MDP7190297.1 hypothetical protein [Alphaproteobacteria bacterium]MDP7456975.1 hypothetical protein [Alphaproteobacteria bacterium]|tara:strand:+ start:1152 stop:1406 length:255 start_codon:yes stop_codon:yes gene_type:complete
MIAKIVNFFGDTAYRKRRWILFIVVLVLVFVTDFLAPREHVEFFWDAIPGWAALFGFISCVLIIVASKFLGHQGGLMKDEDYYE